MDLSINEGTLDVTGGPGDSPPPTAIVSKKNPRGAQSRPALSLNALAEMVRQTCHGTYERSNSSSATNKTMTCSIRAE
jgi:hypothetical protein